MGRYQHSNVRFSKYSQFVSKVPLVTKQGVILTNSDDILYPFLQ